MIVEVLKPANIIFRWEFKVVKEPGAPRIEFINGRNVVHQRNMWTEGEIEFIENPSTSEIAEMAEKLKECQREAEQRLPDQKKLFGTSGLNLRPF